MLVLSFFFFFIIILYVTFSRSFDFEIELKNGVVHTFSSIEKEEYGKLYDFINAKKLHVKNKKSVSFHFDCYKG